MATSPRKTIKSNPLDSIATNRSESGVPGIAKKTAVRRVKPKVVVQATEAVLPSAEKVVTANNVTQARPRAQATLPSIQDNIASVEILKSEAAHTEVPESVSPKVSSHETDVPGVATPASALTAEEVLEREFAPSTAMVMVPSDLFDDDRYVDVHALHTVKSWSQWAVLAGLIPTPVIDTVAISAVQIKMIHALCKLYNVKFKKEAALAVVSGLVGGSLTTTLAGMGGVILSNLPGIGSFMKYTAQPALSYASTYALGRVFMRHFEDNGTMIDMDSKKLEIYFKEQYAKGRKMFKYDFKTRQPKAV